MPDKEGVGTIFFYTKENIPRKLQELLHYMEDTEEKNKAVAPRNVVIRQIKHCLFRHIKIGLL